MKPRACVVISNSNHQILLIRRTKPNRVYWVFPGGSVEEGETAMDAAKREALEEVNLTVDISQVLFENDNDGRHETYFEVSSFEGKVKLGNGPEQDRASKFNTYECVWVNSKELLDINLLPVEAAKKVMERFSQSSTKR